MIKKTITFEDLDGNEVSEDWWFNISKGDIAELAVGNELADRIKAIATAGEDNVDAKTIIPAFKEILALSVGKRVNNRFMRSPEITAEFMGSEACSEVLFGLLSNAEEAAEFVNNLMPKDLLRQIENVELPKDNAPTREELLSMSDEDFYAAVGENPRHWSREITAIAMARKNRQPA